jgi:DNA-binding MarR family transcriptional regulator
MAYFNLLCRMSIGGKPMAVRDDILNNQVIADAWRINYLANLYSLTVNRDLKSKYGLTRQEFVILFCLTHSSNVAAQDVCLATGRPKNTISRAVHTLIQKGYIKKASNPSDGRSEILNITIKGAKAYDQVIPILVDRENEMMACLNRAERKTLDRLLTKLAANFDTGSGPYRSPGPPPSANSLLTDRYRQERSSSLTTKDIQRR